MPFPPHAFSGHDGRAYSDWEVHKLAARGLFGLSALAMLGSTALTAATWLMPDLSAAATTAAIAALGAALATLIASRARRAELQHPWAMALGLCAVLAVGGGLVSGLSGGLAGPLGMGLVPVIAAWPLLFPSSAQRTAGVVLLGVAAHSGVSLLLWWPSQAPVAVLATLFALAALSVASALQLERWRHKAAEASRTDWLTGALSRPYLEERLAALCAQRQRSLAPFTLVMFDVDRFKAINDSYGRSAGDEVLEMLVFGMKAEIRNSDFLGRVGGDEFLLVLDECDADSAVKLLERLRARFAGRPVQVSQHDLRLSFSAGVVACVPGEVPAVKELFRQAERALQASKDSARNRTSLAPVPSAVLAENELLSHAQTQVVPPPFKNEEPGSPN